ncbi:hypothetical protein DBR11_20745 [Pedobacter sp. HMWF019]|nr:hypothetical protein DBR11_20745 [Pedobacter sp. HMWF019]
MDLIKKFTGSLIKKQRSCRVLNLKKKDKLEGCLSLGGQKSPQTLKGLLPYTFFFSGFQA